MIGTSNILPKYEKQHSTYLQSFRMSTKGGKPRVFGKINALLNISMLQNL
jgi:hypothetical protein